MCCGNLKVVLAQIGKSALLEEEHQIEENGKSFTIAKSNESNVYRIAVEHGLIDDNVKGGRCECIFYTCPPERVFFVELKGTDVKKGCKQLLNSLNVVVPQLKLNKNFVEPWLIYQQHPKTSQRMRKYIEEFRRAGYELTYSNNLQTKVKL